MHASYQPVALRSTPGPVSTSWAGGPSLQVVNVPQRSIDVAGGGHLAHPPPGAWVWADLHLGDEAVAAQRAFRTAAEEGGGLASRPAGHRVPCLLLADAPLPVAVTCRMAVVELEAGRARRRLRAARANGRTPSLLVGLRARDLPRSASRYLRFDDARL